MSNLEIALLSFPVLLVLIFARMPIGLAMLICGFFGNWLVLGRFTPILAQMKTLTFTTFSSYSLSIIPLFLLMGQFAAKGDMSQALFRAANGWLGHHRGGVAMAAIGACAGFGAICGSSIATAATMGKVALPELKRFGYDGGLATGALAAGGTLGILIPPSVILVIYAILTEQNIAKLFLAAFIPGVLAALGYLIVISVYVRLYPASAGTRPRVGWADRLRGVVAVWPVLIVFALVVGGIYAGWFTPTEGAAVGALGTGVIAWANGGLTWATLGDSFMVTARSTAMIFFIVLGAAFYNGFLALTQVPQEIALWVVDQGLSPLLVLTLILIFYLVLGCLMDSLSMILLTIPIFWPVMQGLDFGFVGLVDLQSARLTELIQSGSQIAPDLLSQAQSALAEGTELTRDQMKDIGLRGANEGALARINTEQVAIWFGILVLIVVEVGLITPPVGMNLFIINAMDRKTPMADTYRAVMFFVASDLIRVAILVAFPVVTLVLIPW